METKTIANRVAAKYRTRDPIRIAEELDSILIYAPLCEIRGMRQYLKRNMIIYINSELDEHQQRFVCAHELGHHFLHRGLNRMFMDRKTYMVPGKYERQADCFAADLIYDDCELQNYLECSIPSVAKSLGLSCELAEYRMSTVNPRLF